jgi:hypothetical protein
VRYLHAEVFLGYELFTDIDKSNRLD